MRDVTVTQLLTGLRTIEPIINRILFASTTDFYLSRFVAH